jgi:hypothetical protein
MKRAPRTCDAPGCSAEIRKGMLMCLSCWRRTPRLLREAIKQAWAEKRIRDWSSACLEARRWHSNNPVGALAARIIGEKL